MADSLTEAKVEFLFSKQRTFSAALERDDCERKSVDRSLQRSISPKFLCEKKLLIPSGPTRFKPLSIQIERKKLSGNFIKRQQVDGGRFQKQLDNLPGFVLVKSTNVNDEKESENRVTPKLSLKRKLSRNLQKEGTALGIEQATKAPWVQKNPPSGQQCFNKEPARQEALNLIKVTLTPNLVQIHEGRLVHQANRSILKNKVALFCDPNDRGPQRAYSPKGQKRE